MASYNGENMVILEKQFFLSIVEIYSVHYVIKGSEKSYTLKTKLFTLLNPVFPKHICPWILPCTELITFHEINTLGTHSGKDWTIPSLPLAKTPLLLASPRPSDRIHSIRK